MSSPVNGVPGSTAREGEMLASAPDGSHSHRFQCRDSSLDTYHGHKLPKFSLNMKNYCSIHLRLLHNMNEDTRHDIFMLNPECHLKFLEENLNCLSRKPGRCNDFKISCSKNSTCSVETSQKVFSLPENRLPSLTITSFSEGCVSRLKTVDRKFDNSCKDTVVFDESKIKMSNVLLQKRIADRPTLGTPPIIKIKEKYSSKNDRSHESHPLLNFKPVATDKAAESMKIKTDIDNQFEFTVAGEKIVSFVCSPPPSRRQKTKEGERNCICDSDDESSSKGSSETASNTSSKSSFSKYSKINNPPQTREQAMKANMFLWNPVGSLAESRAAPPGPSSFLNRQVKQKPNESSINFFGTINSLYAISSTNERKLNNCSNQETVMFRETALRGCYDIDTILKEVNLASPDIEKEVNRTREAIFSAVRLQRGNDSIVSDSVQSIVDICNSWIKLNAHFERKDFKLFLESNGVDLSILSDFSQWQCMSRMFVDKLINVLKKVSLGKDSNISTQHVVPKRGAEMACVPTNTVTRSDILASCINRSVNPSLSAIESQGKRWKQRRYLSEKTDSKKEASAVIRPCGSTFLVDSCIQNPLMVNITNTDTLFGQGDNGLNFTKDYTKVNHALSTKNCQLAQGDLSLFLNGPKHSSNYGFFDKNISVPNFKCCSVIGETNICPVSSTNDLSTPVTNLVDIPVNNYFPINVQQAVPTIPPLYNNQICLINANQYQASFNHSLAKPNPIHCVDSEVGDSFVQNSYMKPGHYAPPQKPPSFQKAVDNTIPIEDIPAVGIPFLYSAPIANSQQPKGLEIPNGLSQVQMSKDNDKNKDADVTWKTALSMAGTFRDSMLEEGVVDDGPNLKISETVSLKSHFLLSDGNSQNSSSSGDSFKGNSDNDEQSFQVSKMNFLTANANLKDSDKLVGSFCKLTLENDNSLSFNMKEEGNNPMLEESASKFNGDPSRHEYLETYLRPSHRSNTFNALLNIKNDSKFCKNENGLNPCLTTQESGYLQKKSRKNKKSRDEYTLFDRKTPMLFNKAESALFTKAMSNKVTCQLEDILNCIWNTKVSTLVEEIKSEKEMAKLELKLRSPLYLQAMRCKLSNHSYDSLDQALADFQQYFVDIRSKSKGDKHCIEAIGALERIFFGLVQKYFGLMLQQRLTSPQYGQSSRPRRPKKTPRRV